MMADEFDPRYVGSTFESCALLALTHSAIITKMPMNMTMVIGSWNVLTSLLVPSTVTTKQMRRKIVPTTIVQNGWVRAREAFTRPVFPVEIPIVYNPGTNPHVIMKLGYRARAKIQPNHIKASAGHPIAGCRMRLVATYGAADRGKVVDRKA